MRQAKHADNFCPAAAVVDPTTYEIEGPADKSRASFELWVNDLATKYPDLKMRYELLLECWEHYTPK